MSTPALRIRRDIERPVDQAGAYIGLAGYAAILACCKTPRTAREASSITGVGEQSMRRLLKQFERLRLLHIIAWVRPAKHGFALPVYLLGDAPSVPAPATERGAAQPHSTYALPLMPKVVAFASILEALRTPRTAEDLAHQAGLSRAYKVLAQLLHADIRLAHVSHYSFRPECVGGPPTAHYQYGPDMPDAPGRRRDARARRKRARDNLRVRRWIRADRWCQMAKILRASA